MRAQSQALAKGPPLKHPFREFVEGWFQIVSQSKVVTSPELSNQALEKLCPAFLDVGVDLKNHAHTLLFRASEHGFSAAKFHQFCDNKAPTVLLVRSTLGSVFGAYIHGCYWSSGRYTNCGGKSFLFSLEEPGNGVQCGVAFQCHNPRQELCAEASLGLGGGDLTIADQCNMYESQSNFGNSYGRAQGIRCGYNFLAKEGRNFMVAEYEVWEVMPRKG